MSKYIDRYAVANKLLNPDGSITTLNGVVISGPNEKKAKEYIERVPVPNKFLNPDGSIKTLKEIQGGAGGTVYAKDVIDEERGQTQAEINASTPKKVIETLNYNGEELKIVKIAGRYFVPKVSVETSPNGTPIEAGAYTTAITPRRFINTSTYKPLYNRYAIDLINSEAVGFKVVDKEGYNFLFANLPTNQDLIDFGFEYLGQVINSTGVGYLGQRARYGTGESGNGANTELIEIRNTNNTRLFLSNQSNSFYGGIMFEITDIKIFDEQHVHTIGAVEGLQEELESINAAIGMKQNTLTSANQGNGISITTVEDGNGNKIQVISLAQALLDEITTLRAEVTTLSTELASAVSKLNQ